MLACTRTVGDEVFIRGVQPLEVLQRHADLAAPCPLRAPHARRHARHRRTRSVLARTRDQFAVCDRQQSPETTHRQPCIRPRPRPPPPHTHCAAAAAAASVAVGHLLRTGVGHGGGAGLEVGELTIWMRRRDSSGETSRCTMMFGFFMKLLMFLNSDRYLKARTCPGGGGRYPW
jgi:hypothetical protein